MKRNSFVIIGLAAFLMGAGVVHEPQNPCDMLVGQSREACIQAGGVRPSALQIYFYDPQGRRYGVPAAEVGKACEHLEEGREYRLFRSGRDQKMGKPPIKAFRCKDKKEAGV
ncbi:MAG: hypothetical protein IT285_04935 [Bdellovibrionales bacterium]|nr:hypothetical protein [Bdellovibrionales bacterium]